MKNTYETLLALIKCALWGEAYDGPPRIDNWENILQAAAEQTVLGLVGDAITYLPTEILPAPSIRTKLQAKIIRIYQSHAALDRTLVETVRLFESHGINTILLKGQGVALNYPKPMCRQCGDIDLYIGEENFEKALKLLDPQIDSNIYKHAHIRHFEIKKEGVSIEIHRVADSLPDKRNNEAFQQWTKFHLEGENPRKEEIYEASIKLPPTEFDAIYIMHHAWHHFIIGGVGLRQLCDWTMYMHKHHKSLDSSRLHKCLETFGLLQAWQIFASMAINYLGLPREECPLYDGSNDHNAAKAIETILDEGNFGYYSNLRKAPLGTGYLNKKIHTLRFVSLRMLKIATICPSYMMKYWISYTINGINKILTGQK